MPRTSISTDRDGTFRSVRKLVSKRRRAHGFTLVELMVAMALLGALTSIIYGLFHTTSQTLLEVESLAETTDSARFALEHIRNDLQAAGSQASPKSTVDPWVVPGSMPVTGIVPYLKWQGETPYPYGTADNDMTAANPASRFDGIIMVGAYDIPQNIRLRDVQPGVSSSAYIAEHVGGVMRLLNSDPFDISVNVPTDIDTQLANSKPEDWMTNRLLRITDRQGFVQFTSIDTATPTGNTIRLGLGNLQAASGDSLTGIDETSESDVEFEAAFIDAFWYHVIPDPFDPTSFQLVRDRLDINAINFINPGSFDPNSVLSPTDTPIERIVIANRVVDFRLWFDCGNTLTGLITDVPWHSGWETPDASDVSSGNDCIPAEVERARIAHIRLSIRTANESSNRQHLTIDQDWPGFEFPDTRMQTYDIEPRIPGAASVVTVQSTVELSNFAIRNLRARP